ncbi:hypothetical protein F511_37137 [Dorcoceras hygrometricum]|uniref:Uncharacterized protein n=1 Tax=Dorcoceras hygrometricum TaxID=472368 RepID=A0A2Z7BQG2_9LAMI|nr:hypothetical protein F511_37137 [Dorcoceras hygrometricum]
MQMDGLPGELSNYPCSDLPSGYHLSSGESEALSVICRGSWGDVPRRFAMVRWVDQKMCFLIHNEFFVRFKLFPSIYKYGNEGIKKDTKKAIQHILPFSSSPSSYRRCRSPSGHRRRTSLRSSRQGYPAREIFIGVLVHSNKGIGILVVERIRSNRRSAISIGEIVGARNPERRKYQAGSPA